ncbi:MalM family protein [Photobacterium japonica]|uniref:MalM family protein n=1 Tax=Photobacterium japonica TaxID=2910235 RepID=UPI003D131A28
MKMMKTTLAALLAATLLGCAASPTVETVKDVTISQAACCTAFSEFAWIPLDGTSIDVTLDAHSQIGEFVDGKSYFAAFALPDNVERMQVDIKSWMRSAGVFAPKVLLLNAQFEVVETITLDDFDVKLSDMFHLASYQDRVVMDRETTPYMVIYSPKNYREGEIQIPHPERVRAEELGLARPMVADPVIQHSTFGSLELDLKPLAMRSFRVTAPATPAVVPAVKNPVADHAPAKVTAAPVVITGNTPAASSVTMLPESEAFYNQQIKAAVDNNDMKKALTLMEEAKRAGSPSAEAVFLQLIKR